MEIIDCIEVSKNSRLPIYQQLADSIINNISNGNIELNQKLPSINMVSEYFYLSRDTVANAYNILHERGIIISIPRKGNYVAKTESSHKLKVLFLLNKMSSYKMRIYNSFLNKIGVHSNVDLVIYHCDELLFLNALKNSALVYDYYVVMPHFKTDNLRHTSFTDRVCKAINEIPKNKLLILDNLMPPIHDDVSDVYQEFDTDIYEALNKGIIKISKYKKFVLVFPERSFYPYPKRILHGFRKFCLENNMDYEIIDRVYEDMILKKGDLFITIEETDLVYLIHLITENEFNLGEEIGVISYNDTLLKDLFGIAVLSTDFKEMGETAAHMILNNVKVRIKVPFNFIDRKSI